MDSTVVHQITDLAKNLGVQARTAFVWWILLRFGINALWAGVVVFALRQAFRVLGGIGDGVRLNRAVKEATGSSWPSAADYAKATRLIIDGWTVKR